MRIRASIARLWMIMIAGAYVPSRMKSFTASSEGLQKPRQQQRRGSEGELEFQAANSQAHAARSTGGGANSGGRAGTSYAMRVVLVLGSWEPLWRGRGSTRD